MKQLIILRGVSGAGKSTVAEIISEGYWPICEADQYHYTESGVYDWKPENVGKAHAWCQSIVRDAMASNIKRLLSLTLQPQRKNLNLI